MNESAIEAAETGLGQALPPSLRRVYEVHDGRYRSDGHWWVVWPLARLADENRRAWSLGLPRTMLAFGDDGAGNPFCVVLDDSRDEVLRWSWIDEAPERSEGDMRSFFVEWVDT